jgi:hypothetical protein
MWPSRRTVILSLFVVVALLAVVGWRFSEWQVSGQLQLARQRWAAQHLSNYRYVVQVGCFCPAEVTEPTRIEVRNDAPVAITNLRTGQPDPSPSFQDIATIDQLFVVIQHALTRGADDIKVQYDATYGYPHSIMVDFHRNATDDEISYLVDQFEVLK